MTSTAEIHRLMDAAFKDSRKEAEPFRALLDATVFVQVPFSDRRDRLRLLAFPRPEDGRMVIPVFTDEVEAMRAARHAATVLSMTGRELMEATPGATLVLDPHKVTCTLYPEEIEVLLATGTVATFDQIATDSMPGAEYYLPESVPERLRVALCEFLPTLPFVERAYVIGLRSSTQPQGLMVLLVVGDKKQGERAVRALLTGILPVLQQAAVPVDVTFEDATQPVPEPVAVFDSLAPVYQRDRSTADYADAPNDPV